MAIFNEQLVIAILRWTARTLGLALFAWVAIPVIAGCVLNPLTTSLRENLITVTVLTMAFGLLAGWKWEEIGGVVTLGGFALVTILDQQFQLNVITGVWLLTGMIYLTCWWRTSRWPSGKRSDQVECVVARFTAKRYWIPLVFILAHAALVGLVGIEIALGSDPMAKMVWIVFFYIDFPMSLCIDSLPAIFSSDTLFMPTILVIGTIQWGFVGFAIQQIVKCIRGCWDKSDKHMC